MTENINLRPLGVDGSIGFSVKAKDTEHNQQIHEGFRQFAFDECDGDYTLALKRLLETYQSDWKYESLRDGIVFLESRIAEMENNQRPKEDVDSESGKKAF